MDDRKNAWVFTCDRWADHGCYILLPINPETLSIQSQLRSATDTTKRGKVVYIARNMKNMSMFKPPEIQFTIPSGNILPMFSDSFIEKASHGAFHNTARGTTKENQVDLSKYTASKPSSRVDMRNRKQGTYLDSVKVSAGANIPNLYDANTPIGVQNLYAFLMLADEQKFYKNTPNKIRVHINSLLYPSLYLRCAFTESGISWTESSEDPGQFNLEFTLRVVGMSPQIGYTRLNEFLDLYSAALRDTQNTSSLDRIKSQMKQPLRKIDSENVEGLRGRVRGNI